MSEALEIVPLQSKLGDIRRFLNVAYEIYRDDPLWVAPLLMDLEKVFLPRNPFLQHAFIQLWVARRDGHDVGRIAGIIDHAHNECHQDQAAFFGFFESVNDPRVSQALFEAAFAWAKSQGMRRVLGPMNPSSNDECGLLIKGFDSSPVLMMPYNPAYYMNLVTAAGFKKAKDLLAFYLDLKNSPTDRLQRVADKFAKRHPDIRIRAVSKKSLKFDIGLIKQVYNEAWEKNWGFVPMTDQEIDFMAERLKPLLTDGLVWIAETSTEPAGFLLAVPDFNEAMKPLKGRLLSQGLFSFLSYMVGWRKPKICRVIVLGVKEAFRGRGIEAVMLAEGLKTGFRLGLIGAEASWILEDNEKIHRVIEWFGGDPYKTYRIYERDLA